MFFWFPVDRFTTCLLSSFSLRRDELIYCSAFEILLLPIFLLRVLPWF